jgi:cytoskeletal protein CcmA (bactofilin family)
MWGNKKPDTPQQTEKQQQTDKQQQPEKKQQVDLQQQVVKQQQGETPQQSEMPQPTTAKAPETPAPVAKPASAKTEGIAMSTDAMRPLSSTPSGSTARLGASLHVKGEISGNEDLHVDGSVEGLIQLEDRKLTVGASAKLTADVVAREVVVYGSVKGNLRARDRIEIKKDGSVVGDLTTARIMIEDGAYFKGSIEIDRTGSSSSDSDLEKPAYTRAAVSSSTTTPAHASTTKTSL